MATATAKAKVVRGKTHVALARWATIWMILFMLLVSSGLIDPNGTLIANAKEWLFVMLGPYVVISFHETSTRDSTDLMGFVVDNVLAFLAFFVGTGIFIAVVARPSFTLSYDQAHILLQCTTWVGIDFFYGIVLSFRIAFAGRERKEE
jgi:hypothetical protein